MNTEMSQPELPFADAVHQLDAGDRSRSIAEPLEADHHGDALLDASVVLLNEVVEVFRRAQLCFGRQAENRRLSVRAPRGETQRSRLA